MSVPGATGTRAAAPSLTALFGHDVHGRALDHSDGKTGAQLERVTVDGQDYVLKHLHPDDDWVLQASGDLTLRPVVVWRDGWLDRLPPAIDHTVVAVAWDQQPDVRAAVLVLRDVTPHLVPEGNTPLPFDQHRGFIDHMAELHATFWGCSTAPGLLALSRRLRLFRPGLAEEERARGGTHPVPTQLLPAGWVRLRQRAPRAATIVTDLLDDPTPLIGGLTATPQTFVHGDWKAGNLGSHEDGRTILLDWDVPGIAPGCLDLAWYVCLNRARLPESKDATFATYRDALERHGIDTEPWWDRQLGLCLLGLMLTFGWEKALGDADELAWWEERTLTATHWLAR